MKPKSNSARLMKGKHDRGEAAKRGREPVPEGKQSPSESQVKLHSKSKKQS